MSAFSVFVGAFFMKLVDDKLSLQQSGTFKNVNYSIEANATTFKMLFKNLYSNIIKAICRELSTNAYDSHIEAGCADVPFKVHLPNHFEPWFSVTDTGAGMSEEFVEQEYTTFFRSNKRNSNEAVGCFGLGAKVPFAYTDSFTVRIRYKGTESIYNPVINQDGIPTLIKLIMQPTKELNGCEVKFAVKQEDFNTFIREAKEIYRWFKVKPIVSGVPGFQTDVEEYLRETPEYAVLKHKGAQSYVVMGNVAYPFSLSELGNYYNYDEGLRAFEAWGVRLYMKLGDVQLTPSREKMNYDNTTKKNLENALTTACTNFKKHVYDDVKNATSLWDARCKLYDISNSFIKYNPNTDSVKWNGIDVQPYIDINAAKITVTQYRKGYRAKFRESVFYGQFHCTKQHPIFYNDWGVKGMRGLKKYMEATGVREFFVFEDIADSKFDSTKWFEETGFSEFIQKTSTIPADHFKVNRQAGISKVDKSLLYKFKGETIYRGNGDDYWLAEEVDMNKGGIYIPISRFYWVKGTETEHPKDGLMKLYENVLVFDPTLVLYGIIPSNMDKLKKFPNWISLDDHLDKIIAKNLKLKPLAVHTWGYMSSHSGIVKNTDKLKFHDKSYFGSFVKILKDACKHISSEKISAFRSILQYRKVLNGSEINLLDNAKDKIFQKYPLFKHLSWSTYDLIPQDALSNYIEFIELKHPYRKTSNGTNKNGKAARGAGRSVP